MSLDKTEVLARRFRHCATRAMMILRTYRGNRKSVGKQQMSSRLLINSVRRISEDFPILKEARREILEDLMDIKNTEKIIEHIEHKRISIVEIQTDMPSPFAFNIITMGYTDIMKMEDKLTFLRRMHDMVKAKISLDAGKKMTKEEKDKFRARTDTDKNMFNYDYFWKEQEMQMNEEKELETEKLKVMAWNLKRVPFLIREHIVEIIDGRKNVRQDFVEALKVYKQEIETHWPPELRMYIINKLVELKELDPEFFKKEETKEKESSTNNIISEHKY